MGNPTGKGGFVVGKSGNKRGRPQLPDHVREFKRYSYEHFIEKVQEFSMLTKEQLKTRIKDPSTTMFDLMFATAVTQASEGDKDARNLIIDRLWGKIKEEVDIKLVKPFILGHLSGETTTLGATIALGLEEGKDV